MDEHTKKHAAIMFLAAMPKNYEKTINNLMNIADVISDVDEIFKYQKDITYANSISNMLRNTYTKTLKFIDYVKNNPQIFENIEDW